MSVRRRRIKERLDRIRKQEQSTVDWNAFWKQVQDAIDAAKARGGGVDLDRFIFEAFGAIGPMSKTERQSTPEA